MRVLVIGADNFVGCPVLEALTRSDWAQPLVLSQTAGFDAAVEMADSIVNCTMGRPDDITEAAQKVFAAAERLSRPPPVVHISSMTVYGSARGRVAENAPTPADGGAYAQAQLAADQLAAQYPQAIRLRTGVEYGPGCRQWSGVIADCLGRGRLGDLGASGDGICNLLFIDDLVTAVLESLRRPQLQGRVFNLAMASPPTWNEYFNAFGKALGTVPIRRISRRRLSVELKYLAPPLKIAQMLKLPLPPPITPSLVAACRQEIWLQSAAAEAQLGLRWTGLGVGLERAAAWWKTDRGR
jgi:nucleoside-diphosphate-sugar epimerase